MATVAGQTPLERAARALYCERTRDPDYDFEEDPRRWHRGMHLDQARAVLQAIREPSRAMVDAGRQHAGIEATLLGDAEDDAIDCWQAMIDAALAD